MKQTYIIILSILISSLAIGQSQNLRSPFHFSKNKSNSQLIHKIVKNQNNSEAYQYGLMQKLDSLEILGEEDGNTFVAYRETFNYNNNGNNTSSIQEYNDGGVFIPELKDTYSYNSNNLLIESIEYYWNENNNNWDNANKINISYSTNSIVFIEQDWQMPSNSWVNKSKDEYFQDSNNNDTLEIDSEWNNSNNSWENKYKYITTYSNGNIETITSYSWINNSWHLNRKEEYSYANGNNTKIVEYVWSNNSWEYKEKTIMDYDANNMFTKIVYLDYNSATNNWDYNDSTSYTNQSMNIDYYEQYDWSGTAWNKSEKDDFTHDNNYAFADLLLPNVYTEDEEILSYFTHKLTNVDIYEGDGNSWELDMKANFYYSEININSIEKTVIPNISITPNPTTGNFYINNINSTLKVEIYDISGKRVKSLFVNESNKIDISELNNGLYFVIITDNENNKFTKKIIKHSEN
jgi:hypothetical protein